MDEKNHGDRFLVASHGFKICGREKNLTVKFPIKVAIAVHNGGKADGDLERVCLAWKVL